MSKNFLKSSLENASLNIVLQISFRVVTFLLNAFVVRHVSQDAIGVMYVRLLLLESTILFLSRDAFRKACLSKTVDHNWRKVINLVWLTVPLCTILSVIFGYVWMCILTPPNPNVTQHYVVGVMAIIVSCVVEMCCEPLYLVSQAFLFVKLRVFADLLSMFIRTLTFVLLILHSAENAVLAFSIAQILSVSSYVLFFYGYFVVYMQSKATETKALKKSDVPQSDFPFHSIADLLPKYSKTDEQIDYKLLGLVWSFLKQGVMMQVLTEGERYVMTLFNVLSFAEQGVFDVVNNLGSLAARFLFRPIEESAYFYFSQLIHRDEDINKQNKTSMDEAAFVLQNLLRCVTTLGLLVLCFGQSYARFVLFLYGGKTLASGLGPKLLRTHCMAVLLMAVNGSTEAYLQSTIDAPELNRHNKLMVVFSVSFLITAWILSYVLGSVGFILANCCNMTVRIIHSISFIQRRYRNTIYRPLSGLLPKKYFISVLAISTVVTQLSELYLFDESIILHFFIGAASFLITIITWLYEERQLIAFCKQHWKSKKQ